ncbi:MAG: acetyltransferase [Burkholderiaceae bacterium]|nr:acetyltransferase [Burkholderiaceae bacterium]
MPSTLAILGAGGHGRVVADCAREMRRWTCIVHYDDDRSSDPGVRGNLESAFAVESPDVDFIVALGNGELRLRWLGRLQAAGKSIAAIVHPSAVVSAGAFVGTGTVVVAGAVVNVGAVLGGGCIVNTLAGVDHDCRLADGVHVSPGAHLAGEVTVGERSWIGIGSAVRHRVRIGRDVVVGAGAVVVRDVPDGCTVVGVPARPVGGDAEGGAR